MLAAAAERVADHRAAVGRGEGARFFGRVAAGDRRGGACAGGSVEGDATGTRRIGGDLWLMSAPYARRGFFWDTWSRGGPGWTRVSVPATECARIPAEFLAEEREAHTEEWYQAGVPLRVCAGARESDRSGVVGGGADG